jgi:triphosphatase
MEQPNEIELKLSCDASGIVELRDWLLTRTQQPPVTDELVSTYYDTRDHRLLADGYSLRVRSARGEFVQTIKAAGDGLLARPEWEWRVEGPRPDPALLAETTLAVSADDLAEIEPIFTVQVERTTFLVEQATSRIELALDLGRIRRPETQDSADSVSVCEIELELKQGSVADVFDLASEIEGRIPVRLGVLSKAERGFDLVRGKGLGVRKAETIRLSPDASAADAFRTIAHACLRQIRLNENVLLDRREMEAVHQMRVGVRRLRSALTLYSDMLSDGRLAGIKAELKRWSEPLGRARDLDVLLTETLPAERRGRPDEAGLLTLEKRLEGRRTDAYAALLRDLRSPEWRRFVLDLMFWINAGPWLSRPGRHREPGSAVTVAASVLDKRRRQFKKRGRDLADVSADERHQFRIAAKKLRYGSEFFSSLFAGGKSKKRRKALLAALEDLQGDLGTLNDAASAHAVLEREAGEAGTGGGLGFAAGLAVADREADTDKLIADAAEAYERIVAIKPFWR